MHVAVRTLPNIVQGQGGEKITGLSYKYPVLAVQTANCVARQFEFISDSETVADQVIVSGATPRVGVTFRETVEALTTGANVASARLEPAIANILGFETSLCFLSGIRVELQYLLILPTPPKLSSG